MVGWIVAVMPAPLSADAAPAKDRPLATAMPVASMTVPMRETARFWLWNMSDPSGPGSADGSPPCKAVPPVTPLHMCGPDASY
ncbi:hypothetical protein GCM10009663_62200 [Kitasatospora arboriphila]|uniref:Uncharacterized protein n=1 Tax=Kitasatospora arboriphila TaxID=258052 RepID=A0ABP4EJX5_9ACTN